MQDSVVPLTKEEISDFALLVASKDERAVSIERRMGRSLREVLAETDPDVCAKTLHAYISEIRDAIRQSQQWE